YYVSSIALAMGSSSAGLLCYNWYPASIFVGNIYTSMAVSTQESFPNKGQGALLAANAHLLE
ncbi:hypothetical protein, partial [Proteus mirabilis]|uniref:hypothetical protein n=1 Tax=Proteus mirabilis TaxID=584 RepID=UPI001954924C